MDTDSEEEEIQKVSAQWGYFRSFVGYVLLYFLHLGSQEEQPGEKVEKLSKKKLKLKNRMSVAELKQVRE